MDYKLFPVYINDMYAPYLLEGEEKEALLSKLGRLSSELKEENLANYEEEEREYKKQVEALEKYATRMMRMNFMSNIYRYPPQFVFQVVTGFLRSHLR